jgi:hypothetical protein
MARSCSMVLSWLKGSLIGFGALVRGGSLLIYDALVHSGSLVRVWYSRVFWLAHDGMVLSRKMAICRIQAERAAGAALGGQAIV